MESFIKEFDHLKIRLEEIKSATDNFHKTKVIGGGGFGLVYVGELSHCNGRRRVAIKRLNRKHGQGNREFWNEITILTRHTHENLISLLGFCDEGGEMILVYEYASNGSLDRHLRSTDFTWNQRLKTCLDIARGISYLHEAKERVLHRDIKSSNILLDANWKVKLSDMGVSKSVSSPGHITSVAGTPVYCDPLYEGTGLLTDGVDVYPFGLLLLEVLCGRLCYDVINGKAHSMVPMWKESYKKNKLHEIIFHGLMQNVKDPSSLKTFADIAFKCLQEPLERPTMPHVVKELENALIYETLILPKNFKEMLMITEEDPLNSMPETELKMLLLKGTLLNRGATWFWLNKDGQHCEMVSIAECLSESPQYTSSSEYISRFAVGCYEPLGPEFKTHVRAQFLSPHIMYTVNLVFKIKKNKKRYIVIEYELQGKKRATYSFLSGEREDGWLTAELHHFTSDKRTIDLEIMFYTKYCPNLLVQGIEFQPLKQSINMQPESYKETYWKQKLPEDFEDIINWSGVRWESLKDVYYIFCEGLLIKQAEMWLSLDKDGKICLVVSARAALKEDRWNWKSRPGTRFKEVANYDNLSKFGIFCKFISKLLSPQTTYGAYLVYQLPEGYKTVNPPPVEVVAKKSTSKEVYKKSSSKEAYQIFLQTPQVPVISSNGKYKALINPSNVPKTKGLPKLRSDGWMEVQIQELQRPTTNKWISSCLRLSSPDSGLQGITVQCLEFRPIYI